MPVQSDGTSELLQVAEVFRHGVAHHPGEGERRPAFTHAEAIHVFSGPDAHVTIQRAEYIVWVEIYSASQFLMARKRPASQRLRCIPGG